ncbi:MAG: hypothetical protein Q9162_007164 [Coniocarpon cinnabarinum]
MATSFQGLCRRCARDSAASLAKRSFTSGPPRQRRQDIRIVEVGPRDGLQNEKKAIPVATKIELVRRLAQTGLRTIEAGSFVSPKWVPQMANSSEILSSILRDELSATQGVTYQWLMPNMKGLENYLTAYEEARGSSGLEGGFDEGPALNTSSFDANEMPSSTSGVDAMARPRNTPSSSTAGSTSASDPPAPVASSSSYDQTFDAGPGFNTSSFNPNEMPSSTSGVDAMSQPRSTSSSASPSPHEISLFLAATESFSHRNTNCSIADSLSRFRPLVSHALSQNLPARAYVSVALGCPYEGSDVNPKTVAEIATQLLEMGVYEISVADTTGMGTPPRTAKLLSTLSEAGVPANKLALHFHDTYGQALVNTLVGLEHGVTVFDSAVGGLGGCPFSPGATGNVATEDLVNLCNGLGVRTGVDLQGVSEVGEWISGEVGRGNESRAGRATLARMRSDGA